MLRYFCSLLCTAMPIAARTVDYDLTVSAQQVAPAGKTVRGLTLNGSIPGPVLRFREGDTARITLRNALTSESTSLHWHGLLLPNSMDGVPRLTTPVIPPGGTFTFTFPLTHAGTYWYHSHTALQEQQGVYGAIVVTPRGGDARVDRDYVLVLSDWTNEHPNAVMRQLMRGTEWYAIRKGTAQSIMGAAQAGMLKDYFSREWSRMPAMDVSDVAYDAFLMNGQRRLALEAKPGERVRLRVINAGASSYFYVESATGQVSIIAADGPAVRPVKQRRLLMGMGETYDLLVTMPRGGGAWEFRATAQDGSGYASAWLGSGEEHGAPEIPRPNLYSMNDIAGAVLDEMDDPAAAAAKPRPLSPYARLRSLKSTALPAHAPRRTLPLHLTGDMIRYTWSINGKPLKEESTIKVTRGEVLRLQLINDTMMHHPMHLHGHFFRVLDDEENPSAHAPLKHTIDVPPMGRRTIEFPANEHGDWFFHCHLLYHMESGMARVFSYDDQGPDHVPDTACDCMPAYWFMAEGSVQSHLTEGMAGFMDEKNDFSVLWNAGWQEADDTEYEIDLQWSRYFNTRWSAFAGYRFTNRLEERGRAFAGAAYRLPLMAELSVSVDSEGDLRAGLRKEFQITSRLRAFGEVEYDTGSRWMWTGGAHYTLTKNLGLIVSQDSDYGFGGGVAFRF
jgi:FtsP/CotA-like multicopper oxidase with cupredoxin domain